jgi:hypothetical protein
MKWIVPALPGECSGPIDRLAKVRDGMEDEVTELQQKRARNAIKGALTNGHKLQTFNNVTRRDLIVKEITSHGIDTTLHAAKQFGEVLDLTIARYDEEEDDSEEDDDDEEEE